jgi:hypothetical protein
VRKWKISEELRRRTHSSSVESPLVEVERRFLVRMCRDMCDHVRWLFSFFVMLVSPVLVAITLAPGVDHSTRMLIHNFFLSASFISSENIIAFFSSRIV